MRHMRKLGGGFLFLFIIYINIAMGSSEPTLVISTSEKKWTFSRSDLLVRDDLTTVQIEHDYAYGGKKSNYLAIPVYRLFEAVSLPVGAVIQFQCLDGFSAPISTERVLNRSPEKSIAYLAIEKPGEAWPYLPSKTDQTAGPFYLVWANPKASRVLREEWPFQLTGFEVKKSLAEAYPALVPAMSAGSSIQRGMQVFTKNCFPCHTLNLQGQGTMGPDLNLPMNPVEYFQPEVLPRFIRDPQSVRKWSSAQMKGFSAMEMTDLELKDLLAYLQHMSHRKTKSFQPN